MDATSYLQSIATRAQLFQPFNLLLYDGQQLMGLESRHQRIFSIPPGIGAVSNADFDTPWPKVLRLKSGLLKNLEHPPGATQPWLSLLQDAEPAPVHTLPDTGIGQAWEQALSAVFIAEPDYGTRVSSIVSIDQRAATLMEQTYARSGPTQALNFAFDLRNIHC